MKKLKIDFKSIKFTPEVIAKIVIIALTIIFLIFSFVSKATSKKTPMGKIKQAQEVNATVTVSAKEIQPETIQNAVKLTGNVSSVSEINIYPDTSGKITNIVKNLGDYVEKGEKIAYIDPSKPGSAYVASPVVATVAGTVIDLPISLGDTVSSSTSIATVGSLKDLQLKVYVAEKYSAYLKTGMKAYVTLTSVAGEKFEATVVKISPVVNKTNRTIEVELHFKNYDARIKPGMFASVELVIQERNGVCVVPKNAISEFNGKQTVLVIDSENIAQRREITTGIENDLDIEVKTGLQSGDMVITAGSATDGSSVRIAGDK